MSKIAIPPSQGWGSFFSTVETYPKADPAGDQPVSEGRVQPIPEISRADGATFLSWDKASQEFYLRTFRAPDYEMSLDVQESGKPSVRYDVRLLNGDVQSKPRGVPSSAWASAPAGTVSKVPAIDTLTAAEFKTWQKDAQAAYIDLVSRTSVPGIALSTGTANQYEEFLIVDRDAKGGGGKLVSRTATGLGLQPTAGMELDLGGGRPTGSNPKGAVDGQIDIPYYHLPGSASGNTGALISAGAEQLFPGIDGITTKLPASTRPAEMSTDPTTIADVRLFLEGADGKGGFNSWHTAYQVEYVNRWGVGATRPKTLEIPKSTTNAAGQLTTIPLMTAVLSAGDPPRLYRVEAITKQDFALMPKADQTAVAATVFFLKYKQTELNLTTDATDAKAQLTALRTNLNDNLFKTTGTNPTGADVRQVFLDQLAMLETKINGSAVHSKGEINDAVKALSERATRLSTFFDARNKAEGKSPNVNLKVDAGFLTTQFKTNVMSLDGGATVRSGFDVMFQQEKTIRDIARSREVAATGTMLAADGSRLPVTTDPSLSNGVRVLTSGTGKRLDAPTLIYLFQDSYNRQLQAEVAIETEYVKQVNALLKAYAVMQDTVNRTLGAFDKTKDDDGKDIEKALEGFPYAYYYDELTDQREIDARTAILMFDSAGFGAEHPVETLQKINRPTQQLFSGATPTAGGEAVLASDTHQQWTTYGTRLSDAVTQLNQESQTRMNDINNMDKQRNRHYELANSALAKMNDALQGILRASA
ncbi:hypothetical protein [Aureimonas jatrophae]|uniref:Uncharacterized protein n=1 Tax=Aureimonas jatrophae TaxID=1166073 RepID=A0A1H0ET50_9HYPH|nr:hypothetical protein [Aureimonas jatrophae]MBB3950329.1 hypothetical protein [Aureimonas jatrophae]SDN85496.1 hypothetical protein SAMN05192530_102206 [Aureimonas jatrophae]